MRHCVTEIYRFSKNMKQIIINVPDLDVGFLTENWIPQTISQYYTHRLLFWLWVAQFCLFYRSHATHAKWLHNYVTCSLIRAIQFFVELTSYHRVIEWVVIAWVLLLIIEGVLKVHIVLLFHILFKKSTFIERSKFHLSEYAIGARGEKSALTICGAIT